MTDDIETSDVSSLLGSTPDETPTVTPDPSESGSESGSSSSTETSTSATSDDFDVQICRLAMQGYQTKDIIRRYLIMSETYTEDDEEEILKKISAYATKAYDDSKDTELLTSLGNFAAGNVSCTPPKELLIDYVQQRKQIKDAIVKYYVKQLGKTHDDALPAIQKISSRENLAKDGAEEFLATE